MVFVAAGVFANKPRSISFNWYLLGQAYSYVWFWNTWNGNSRYLRDYDSWIYRCSYWNGMFLSWNIFKKNTCIIMEMIQYLNSSVDIFFQKNVCIESQHGIHALHHLTIFFWSPFYWHGLTFIPAWISNYNHYKVWDGITYIFLTATFASFKFGNGISLHTLLGMYLLIHGGIKVNTH